MNIDTESLKLKVVKGDEYLLCPLRIKYPKSETKVGESKVLLNLVADLVLSELNNPNVSASTITLYSKTEKGFKSLFSWGLCGMYLFYRRQRKTKGHFFGKSFLYTAIFQFIFLIGFNALIVIPNEQILRANVEKYLPPNQPEVYESFMQYVSQLNLKI